MIKLSPFIATDQIRNLLEWRIEGGEQKDVANKWATYNVNTFRFIR